MRQVVKAIHDDAKENKKEIKFILIGEPAIKTFSDCLTLGDRVSRISLEPGSNSGKRTNDDIDFQSVLAHMIRFQHKQLSKEPIKWN